MSDVVRFHAVEVRKTNQARLLELEDGREVWIPESQLLEYPGGMFSVPDWLAREKDIT